MQVMRRNVVTIPDIISRLGADQGTSPYGLTSVAGPRAVM